ncbi:hybrid sensor histidine kinase/response regulator [Xylophilus sp. GOD-11R]|uniref:hybrid sensor histidine kinase/response regulator n=1 Tax=Xylophilus sp. GOD-11R TaxID=3089814 RepID=UPI00298D0723|nr:ATP-binding protein [Xylophilus sp. GOD-11R]WPB57003.1 ATP-binding protein [Xylophilus sp. GOD-11R]
MTSSPFPKTDEGGFDQRWRAEAINDLRISQSVALVRHLPTVLVGNGLGMLFAVFLLRRHYPARELVPLMLAMAYLLAPIALTWWKLRHRPRPISVSVNHLRRQVGYSAVLGCFWAACMAQYAPAHDFTATSLLALGLAFLALGSAATFYVLPMAALSYAVPILCAALYVGWQARSDMALLLIAMLGLMAVATLGIVWGNWTNFREVLRLIQEKSQLLHEAEVVRRAEEEFVENLNHEIRNALTSVIGYFDVAANPDLSPQEHLDMIEHARETGGLLQVLLSDLLDVGRLNAGRTRLALAPLSFRQLVRTTVISASAAINGRDLSVRTNIDASVPEVLIGDAARLQQILLNLVGNALKVMETGTVIIQARYRGNFNPLLEIVISDDGPGIPVERQRSLFHRFSRLSEVPGNTGPTVGGWGLGLSICAALVELMHGDIRVSSEIGRGAAFTIRLPLLEERRKLPREEAAPQVTVSREAVAYSALEALVVDDTAANRLILRKMLQALGCRVAVASDGAEAVLACTNKRFNLVFMDLELGEMDGITATRHIRALPGPEGRMPIVAITGFASMERVAAIQESGMNDYVLKPVRLDTLASVVKKWAR